MNWQVLPVLCDVIAFLSTIVWIAARLEDKHREAWVGLARPAFPKFSRDASLKLSIFVLFSTASLRLHDRKLEVAVWVSRITFIVGIAGIVLLGRHHG